MTITDRSDLDNKKTEPLSGIVGIIYNGRRFTDDEVREALAKGAQREADRQVEGEAFFDPNECAAE